MRTLLASLLFAALPLTGALADDLADCAQNRDAKLKFAGCSHLISKQPDLALAYSSRGVALATMGQDERAIADYSHALSLDARLAVVHYNRGLVYLEIGEAELAASDFEQVIALDPTDATAFNGRGMAYVALGREPEARADFAKAIELDPNYARAYLNRASLNLARGQFEDALADFDKVLQLRPGDPDARSGRTYAANRSLPPDVDVVGSTSAMPANAPDGVVGDKGQQALGTQLPARKKSRNKPAAVPDSATASESTDTEVLPVGRECVAEKYSSLPGQCTRL